jgi:hypothetical protein
MAQSETDLANMALGHLGGAPPFLAAVSTDVTKEAIVFRQFLDNARKGTLRSHPWNFATKRTTLSLYAITGAADNGVGLIRITCSAHPFITGDYVRVISVGGTTEANDTWTITKINANTFDLVGSEFETTYEADTGEVGYAPQFGFHFYHVLPTDYIRFLRNAPDQDDPPDYRVETKIATDETEIELTYIYDNTVFTMWDPLAYNAASLLLAWMSCYGITGSRDLKDDLWKEFHKAIKFARTIDSQEDPAKIMTANLHTDARISYHGGYVRDPMT